MMRFDHRDLVRFRNDFAALEHLCDHVLTSPEAFIWYLLFDNSTKINPVDEEAVLTYAKRLWSDNVRDHPSNAQGLYDAYREKLAEAKSEAEMRGWTWKAQDKHRGDCWYGLDRYGIFIVWEDDRGDEVRTAMILAFVAPEPKTTPTESERQRNPLPRRGKWEPPRDRRGDRRGPDGADFLDLRNPNRVDRPGWFYFCFRRGMQKWREKYDAAGKRHLVKSPPAFIDELDDDIEMDQWKQLQSSATRPIGGVRV